jgi:hypothetical protein
MAEKHLPAQESSSSRFELLSYLASTGQFPTTSERRHYSFDTDSELPRYPPSSVMDYDQTEGLGGLSVSSYESIEDERSPIDPAVMRSYPYNGRSTTIRRREGRSGRESQEKDRKKKYIYKSNKKQEKKKHQERSNGKERERKE